MVMKEKFKTHLNKKVPFRNKNEKFLVEYLQKLCKEPLEMSLEQLKHSLIGILNKHRIDNKNFGEVFISDISVFGSIRGESNIQKREFAIYGPGRKTYTLLVFESLFKDANKNFEIAKCVFNNNI